MNDLRKDTLQPNLPAVSDRTNRYPALYCAVRQPNREIVAQPHGQPSTK
jgi:hypothetical protein